MIACKMTEGCLALDGSTLGLLERAEPRAPILRGSVGGRGGGPCAGGTWCLGRGIWQPGLDAWLGGEEAGEQRAESSDRRWGDESTVERKEVPEPEPSSVASTARRKPSTVPSLPFPCLAVHYTSVRTFLRYYLPNGGLPRAPMAAGGSQTKPPSFTSRFPISPTRWATTTVLAADSSSRNASPTADRQRPNGEARGGGDGQTHTG